MQDRVGGQDGWMPCLDQDGRPVYLAIADAIARDMETGILSPGIRLPTVRHLAERLGVDVTTVSRAYGEARRRGLVAGRVGQGTFVQSPAAAPMAAAGGVIDMSMNAPPSPGPALLERMRGDLAALSATLSAQHWMGYGDHAGAAADRAAGLRWLSSRLPGMTQDRVVVTAGAQGALLALLAALVPPGGMILAEDLTYPGLRALAAQLGIGVSGLPRDDQGVLPDALSHACETLAPRLFYCNPTLHNPTTQTMSDRRRADIVAVARRHGLPIVEDDAYGMLVPDGPPPLAAHAPDLVYHVAGLAKCLSPALRIAYLAVPDARCAARLAGAVRATQMAASPLGGGLASRWIETGLAHDILAAIRAETRRRQAMVRAALPSAVIGTHPDAFHLWLTLPSGWRQGDFTAHLRAHRVVAAASDAFSVGETASQAVRLCLGVMADGAETGRVLSLVAGLLDQPPLDMPVV